MAKKVMIGYKNNLFSVHFQNKRWVQSLLAHGPKKLCLIGVFLHTFFSITIHGDPTCSNEINK
jgi:hypothetical protein